MFASQSNQNNKNDRRSNDLRSKKRSNANRQLNSSKIDNNKKNGEKSVNDVADKFKEVQKKHIEAAKKHVKAYESSSEEELENNTLLESVFKNYHGEKDQLRKTQDFLENVFQCNTAACLICIATVKRTDFIWSCENCFSFFHLNCIQRWAKDSTQLKKLHDENEGGYYNNLGEYIPKKQKVINWCCPKCRFEYEVSEIPQQYFCFCKKEINPANHPWIVPHSCGEICNKPLKSSCGHRCVLLCHPGDCPPCPQIITISCECGSSKPRTIRCSQNSWKCANKCKQKLECGIHVCGSQCHPPSQCPPCTKKSTQRCICGSKTQERNCNSLNWTCDKVCNKMFECDAHRCKVKCHAGDCGTCPFGRLRSCPCGKELTQAPCSEEIGPCGNTCQKTLECDNHICAERCHKGNCSQCLEIVEKKCRCGIHTKEFPCSKQLTCETKCKKMRDCNKHACNRKCCNGQCPPCDKICGKVLSCGKHKCNSLCHNGLCYPCAQTATVRCKCGNTVITVPCGREKKTKPPKCNLPCKIPSKCHHTNYHKCHINECPTCVQPCMLENDTTKCNHPCAVRCHDAVKVQIIDKNYKPSTPWEVQPEKFEIKKLPHPPCEVKVSVECIGGHETSLWPCWNSKPMSCGRKCGRKLTCGMHVCELICHTVENKGSTEKDRGCADCVEGCHIPRPKGCVHRCQRRCHLPPCELCDVSTKTSCHCGLTQIYYKCGKFYRDVTPEEEEELKDDQERQLSCGNRCIKNFSCGHRCTNLCHTGQCINAEFCKKKLKVYCECKTKKIETTCDKVRAGFVLNCDEVCKTKQLEIQKAAEEIERVRRQQEEEKNRLEIEEFEKKFAKKKYKERKKQIIETENNQHLLKWLGVATGVAVLAIFISYLLLVQ